MDEALPSSVPSGCRFRPLIRSGPGGDDAWIFRTVGSTNDGAEDGAVDGAAEWADEGISVGPDVGTPDGTDDGSVDGAADGGEVGLDDGASDGAAEGARDGDVDGKFDGKFDGKLDGVAVGIWLGLLLGAVVGHANSEMRRGQIVVARYTKQLLQPANSAVTKSVAVCCTATAKMRLPFETVTAGTAPKTFLSPLIPWRYNHCPKKLSSRATSDTVGSSVAKSRSATSVRLAVSGAGAAGALVGAGSGSTGTAHSGKASLARHTPWQLSRSKLSCKA